VAQQRSRAGSAAEIAQRAKSRTAGCTSAQAATSAQLDQVERDVRVLERAGRGGARHRSERGQRNRLALDARVAQVRDRLARASVEPHRRHRAGHVRARPAR
jgi:hypothetical protein